MDDQGTNRVRGGMKYRKLRIAWSVACGVACLLLIALWVRSYFWFDTVKMSFDGERAYWLGSVVGELRFGKPMTHRRGFRLETYDTPAREWVKSEAPKQSVLGFWWGYSSMGFFRFIIPHWFPVFLAAAIGAAPWMRFSLRTLLIAMTLVAVGLGWFVYALRN